MVQFGVIWVLKPRRKGFDRADVAGHQSCDDGGVQDRRTDRRRRVRPSGAAVCTAIVRPALKASAASAREIDRGWVTSASGGVK